MEWLCRGTNHMDSVHRGPGELWKMARTSSTWSQPQQGLGTRQCSQTFSFSDQLPRSPIHCLGYLWWKQWWGQQWRQWILMHNIRQPVHVNCCYPGVEAFCTYKTESKLVGNSHPSSKLFFLSLLKRLWVRWQYKAVRVQRHQSTKVFAYKSDHYTPKFSWWLSYISPTIQTGRLYTPKFSSLCHPLWFQFFLVSALEFSIHMPTLSTTSFRDWLAALYTVNFSRKVSHHYSSFFL